jgi:ComF family protein
VRDEGCGECRGRPLGFDAAFALGPYKGPIRALCLRLKHQTDAWLAPWLAGVLLEARPALRVAAGSGGALVVPVPLHWQRWWVRGYNQSDELARGLARRVGVPRVRALRRVKSTRILAGLGRAERAELLRNAFVARPAADQLKDKTVFLVDDIMTSGATCGAAARALKRAGAARVVAVVIARADGRA